MVKRITFFIIFFFFLLSFIPVFSQTATLQGTVTDKKTGKFLNRANITVTPVSENIQTAGSTSNFSGNFEIKKIPPGLYKVTVTFIGYETFIIKNLSLSPDETMLVNISLTPRVLKMAKVEVSALRPDKELLESSASVTVVDSIQIQIRHPLSLTDHVAGLSGVDYVKTGVTGSLVAIRGFNDIFSGSLLLMVDNRIARVPSLRFNAYGFLPNSNEDIKSIKIIRGPASSLYGPNSANGVMHILTRSPFGSEGNMINCGIGGRNMFTADFRYAGSYRSKIGYKFTGSFIQGNDFESRDSFEDSLQARMLYNETYYQQRGQVNPNPPDKISSRIGMRDFLIEKLAGTAYVEYRKTNNMAISANLGINRARNMELTQLGAAVVDGWRYMYGQLKFTYNQLFMQSFVNLSNSGDSYLTRDGNNLTDKSKFFSYQIQNRTFWGNWQAFTYGFDTYLTRPITEGTVNGVNEHNDNITESGLYLHSESKLSPKFAVVLAGRLDKHNFIKDPFFSPKAGFIFSPNQGNRFRVSINRAFSTPKSEHLFLDRLISPLIPDIFISFSPYLKFQPFNVRVRGVPKSGYNFVRDNGTGVDGLYMQPSPLYSSPSDQGNFMPADATLMWSEIVEIISQIEGSGLDYSLDQLQTMAAPTSEEVGSVLKMYNLATGTFEQIDPTTVKDISSLKSTKTTSFELGYKGEIGNRLRINADLYYNKIENFISPLLLSTPSVFFDKSTLADYLRQNGITDNAEVLIANMFAKFPVGTVKPAESIYPGDLILTYKNFGDLDIIGLDLDFTYIANNNLQISGAYSFVNKDIFMNVGGLQDITLNAPKNKGSFALLYKTSRLGFNGSIRYRFVNGFPVNSGIFNGKVESFSVFDLSGGFDLPGKTGIRLIVTVQNLLNNKHREFVGAPEIGRLALLNFTYFPDRTQH